MPVKILWRSWLIMLHMLLCFALVAVILYKTEFGSKIINKADQEYGEHYENMLWFHERSDAALPANRIILLGDSLVQGLPASAVDDTAVNYGIGADTIKGLIHRIPKYGSLDNASAILLAIGINDMRHADNKMMESAYLDMLQMLPDHVPYYCGAALPLDETVERKWQGRSNVKFKDWNTRLKRICEASGGTYIPVPDEFSQGDGALPSQFHDGDGLHLNAAGNAVWAAHLRKSIVTQ